MTTPEPWAGDPLVHTRRISLLAMLAGALLLGASIALPWWRAGVTSHGTSASAFDVTPVAFGVGTAALLIAIAAIIENVVLHYRRCAMTCVLSVIAAGLAALQIIAFDTVSGLIPSAVVPKVVRREVAHLGAGRGLWLALFAALLTAASAMGITAAVVQRVERAVRVHGWRQPSRQTTGVALIVAATVVCIWLRYQPWVDGSIGEHSISLEGRDTPWVGPLSLLAVFGLLGGLGGIVVERKQLGALLTAAAGWLTTFCAGLVIVTTGSFARIEIRSLFSHDVRQYSPSVDPTFGVWCMFAAGLVAAIGGAVVIESTRIRNEIVPRP